MPDEQLVSTLARKFRVDIEQTPANATAVTAVASTDVFTSATAHGLVVGDTVVFTATLNGVVAGTTYYVKTAPSATTFTVSAISATGTVLDLTSDITTGESFRKSTWLQIRAISNLQPKKDDNFEDDSDYDSGGWMSETKTAMKWSLEMALNRKIGFTSKAYDPGQEVLRLAADQFGTASVVHVRWYDRNGLPEAWDGYGSVEWGEDGGDMKSRDTVKCVIHGNGVRNTITNPVPLS